MSLKFGIWDSFERLPVPAGTQYAQRIAFVRRAEALGFYGYHVAEHHLSPLSMAPSPLTYLAALASATTSIRLGTMVLIVPLYPSIRLAEEICVVDGLSGGRLEVGVGRGIRDVEHEWYGRDPHGTRAAYEEAFGRIRSALTSGKIEVQVPGGGTDFVPFLHEPTQRPAPPFWYVGNMAYAAEHGMSVLAFDPSADDVEQFFRTWDRLRAANSPHHQGGDPLVGSTRPILVAGSQRDAEALGRRAWEAHGDHFWATDVRVQGDTWPRGGPRGPGGDFADALARGQVIVGTADVVRDRLSGLLERSGPRFSYLVSSFQWGDLTDEEATESLERFAADVAPALRQRHAKLVGGR